jgi:hypothetical protein
MVNPGMWGRRLAEFLREKLGEAGYRTDEPIAEDFGWFIGVHNETFPMSIACAACGDTDEDFQVHIHPSTPTIRRGLFKKVETTEGVERLSSTIHRILSSEPGIRDLEWLDG